MRKSIRLLATGGAVIVVIVLLVVVCVRLRQTDIEIQPPGILPDNEKYEKLTPKQAATAFFDACSKENWDEMLKFWEGPLTEKTKDYLGSMQVVSMGEPFKSNQYHGWYVPYEIKLKNGEVKKFNLALSNRNPGKRYVVDGGI